MLVAIQQRLLQKLDAQIELAVDVSFGSYKERATHGLMQKIEISRIGRSKLALNLMPKSFRHAVGVVRDAEVDAILDASGFAFGDQHPLERTTRFAQQAEKWASQGKPVILLPQALGPFEKPGFAEAFARIVNASALVYARDRESLNHANKAAGTSEKLRLAPDFTNLIKPDLTVLGAQSKRVCIVPNNRMLEKAISDQMAKDYLELLVNCVDLVAMIGLEPVVLQHGEEDAALIEQLLIGLSRKIPIHKIADPCELKQFIGESHLLIGSRFHALVSALSQGVPALATSWSHKYEALFEDYGQREYVISVDTGREELRQKLEQLIGSRRPQVLALIRQKAQELENRTQQMWCEVEECLGLLHQRKQN